MNTLDLDVIALRTSKTIYRDGDTVIKVFDNGYSKADILNEALNHARIEETGLNIPKLLEVMMIDGRWAIRSEFIEGTTLLKLYEEQTLPRDKLLADFIDLQILVHSRRSPLLNRLKDKMSNKIRLADIDVERKNELQTNLESMPKRNNVCHGDFTFSNIIIRSDGTPFIIDWSHATQGDAAADVALTYLTFHINGKYDLANKYLNMFCQRSGMLKRYVLKWLPLVAAAQSVKGFADQKEFLLSWVDIDDGE